MKNLINFLIKYHALFLFLFLEMVCLSFIVRYNNFQRVRFLNSSNYIAGSIYERYNNFVGYFSLRKVNDELSKENAKLRGQLQSILLTDVERAVPSHIDASKLNIISAKVINNSVNKRYNYITINKGRRDGIKPDMGIIGPNGVVGMVINVSEHYATALSVLNGRWKLSAKLSKSNYFGSISWDGQNPYLVSLEEIPFHVQVEEGEEVYTSGYSAVFPEGILIGQIVAIENPKGANFQRLKVQLSTDFYNLYYVDVIEEKNKFERMQIEKQLGDEE
jgi:rod shape-determining protein MreC